MALRGRTLYRLASPLLNFATGVLRCLPRSCSSLLLQLTRHTPTIFGMAIRSVCVRRLARKCGRCVAIFPGAYLFRLEHAEFGDNVSIHEMCYLDATGGLTIGDDVSIAHASSIMTTEHDYSVAGETIRDAEVRRAAVTIGDDVWVGCGVRILAGVTVDSGSVIGAGSVVTKDVPAGTIAVGVPCKPLKGIEKKAA